MFNNNWHNLLILSKNCAPLPTTGASVETSVIALAVQFLWESVTVRVSCNSYEKVLQLVTLTIIRIFNFVHQFSWTAHENIRSFRKIMTNFIHLHLNYVVQLTLLCCQRHGFLPILAVMFGVILALMPFIHTVLTKQEAVSLCLLEIVTHRHIWPIFQCVMHVMRLEW